MNTELLRTELKYVTTGIKNQYMQVAKLLHSVYHNELWQVWGFESFPAYCKSELGWTEKKSKQFVRIRDTFVVGCQIPSTRVDKLDWDKAVMILKVITQDPQKWIDLAETLPKDELRNKVLEAKGKLQAKRRFVVSLTPEAYKTVEWALSKAEAISKIPNRAWLLEYICVEYAMNTPDIPKEDKTNE